MKYILLCLYLVFLTTDLAAQIKVYAEMYRPQFHVSPSSGFMGDPNGPIKYAGKYHLFWWGHLRSTDLVYWEEINKNALNGTPNGFGNWSGSVVVDTSNTSGFGLNGIVPMVAAYTLHENATGIQRQAISSSLTYGSFDYYSGNPVINSTSHDFRDPQVFWHKETSKWIMVVSKPVDRAIEIYSSADLKLWNYESTYVGRGARKEVWEVPDLFELSVNGIETNKKWVMTCGMGPNRMQFWVGSFDGHQFTLDPEDNLMTGKNVSGEIFEDFETSFDGWTVQGDAFGTQPAQESLPNQQTVSGFIGNGYANSYHGGDATTGKLTSSPFTITKRFINFLVGGGASSSTKLSVIVDGKEITYATSPVNQEMLRWVGVDVSNAKGKTANIEITDAATGSWGHTLIDQIVFSDVLYDTKVEMANWADWGSDFYAAKSFRNYDGDDARRIWLAWMGNWTYAKYVPTSPWQGFESIPRELGLLKESLGYELVQKPIQEFEKIRLTEFAKAGFSVSGVQQIDFSPLWNVYELKVKFKVKRVDQVFGLNLAESNGQKVVVSYSAKTSNLSLTRPSTHFSYGGFSRESKAPLMLKPDSTLDLHIFVDQSSVEVFANDYKVSISSLAFTNVNETMISLFSQAGDVEVLELQAWPLKSIWGVTAAEMERPPTVVTGVKGESTACSVFPNPVMRGQEVALRATSPAAEIHLSDFVGRRYAIEATGSLMRIPDGIAPGMYFLNIVLDGRRETIKIIVE
ncbi:MAG: GH32 C-terminal domain-containing protein [Cyclobacteriaceae bacterium]|nr:GH32 C-terminal domain-containing protein [Cyclobacteriaceae bacterium]